MKSLGVCYWYVRIQQCRYKKHGLEHITFYVKKYMAPLAVCSGCLLVHSKLLGAPTFVRLSDFSLYEFFNKQSVISLYKILNK